jgi:hypothetical protein
MIIPSFIICIGEGGICSHTCTWDMFLASDLKKWVVRPVIEEAGCQARENSLQLKELLRINSQGAKLELHGYETPYLACC